MALFNKISSSLWKTLICTYYNIKYFLFRLERFFVSITTITAIIAMFACTIILISFTATQMNTEIGVGSIYKDISNWTLNTAGISVADLNNQQYRSLLVSFTGSIAVLVTLWFSIITTIKYIYNRSELKRHSLIKKERIYQDGTDDLNVMLRFYKKADKVTVFSGDFSWINANTKLKSVILRLASEKKISLVSYKSRDDVIKAINDTEIFETLEPRFIFDNEMKIKCSLVNTNQSSAFLYKVDKLVEGGGLNVCIISSRDDANYLLETLASFCIPFSPA